MICRCRKCRKKLTDPESVKRGFGPECWYQLTGQRADKTKRNSVPEDKAETLHGQLSIFDYITESQEEENNG